MVTKMVNRNLFYRLSEYEDGLIREFHSTPFFRKFTRQTDQELKDYLIQKWFVSENFVPWYDRAINRLNSLEAKFVLKRILQDETPIGKPSHREDLLVDLEYIGITKREVFLARPTTETLQAVLSLNSLVDYSEDPDYDLKIMVALRIAGEILVAEEYRHVVPELEKRFCLKPENSRFYAPHFYHDRKEGNEMTLFEHTTSFEATIGKMIVDENKLDVARQSARKAYEARVLFYNQFVIRG